MKFKNKIQNQLNILTFGLVFVTFLPSCSSQNPVLNEMEFWKLCYRMVWNAEFGNNPKLAEKQLDSMFLAGNMIEDKILHVGIKFLYKTNNIEQIKTILSSADSTTLAYMCSKDLFKNELSNLITCENYFRKEEVDNLDLQRKLAIMFIDDQNHRMNRMENLIKKYQVAEQELIPLNDYKTDVDTENQKKLKAIIKQYGFPTKKLVGKDGMEAVFYVIQHAGDDQTWQAEQLPLVKRAVDQGDMELRDYVYLYDRIKFNANLPQKWGTQCARVNKKEELVILHTVEDPKNLDKRRKEAGLEPIEFYKKLMLIH